MATKPEKNYQMKDKSIARETTATAAVLQDSLAEKPDDTLLSEEEGVSDMSNPEIDSVVEALKLPLENDFDSDFSFGESDSEDECDSELVWSDDNKD